MTGRETFTHTSTPQAHDPERAAGILLHPTSLPGSYGIGDLGDEAIAFLDWAASAGMKLWQVLPLNPPGYGNSPYGCLSAFAGNPLLISPRRLQQEHLLPSYALTQIPHFDADRVDFDSVTGFKTKLLRLSHEHFARQATVDQKRDFEAFLASPDQTPWLDEYALYVSLKEQAGGKAWCDWPSAIATREKDALQKAQQHLQPEIRFHKYVQFLFFRQWQQVREAAALRHIRIIGDVPIYVACDSAEVWSHPELFQLDESGHPTVVAGVPPDYFSATGQRWGNPLYRWDLMRDTGFAWWIARIRANLRMSDIVRLDHFRGFAAYWEIPASETTAINGRWMPGPGRDLFDALRAALGELPLIAEDLGFITKEVHDLRSAAGLPGMKILQFGFAQIDNPHLPHRYEARTVAYTGTHDNDTARGWFAAAGEQERQLALSYLRCRPDEIESALIQAAYTSVAQTAIVPVQDILALGTEARMNRPGDSENNWAWRMRNGALRMADAERLRRLAEITGRF